MANISNFSSIIVAALLVCLASFVAELASSNQVAIVQEAGTVYEQPGLTNQLMLASLDTVMLQIQVDASAPIQLQGVSVSRGFSVPMVHESQLCAWKVRQTQTRFCKKKKNIITG